MLTSFKNTDSHTTRGDIHDFNTRHRTRFDVPFVRLSKTKQSHKIIGLKCLNKLPDDVLSLPLMSFKTKIYQWLIDNPFYNIKEFFELPTPVRF